MLLPQLRRASSLRSCSASLGCGSRSRVRQEIGGHRPCTVNSSKDRGYQAENTLAGSRLNTSLRDTPSSVSVCTEQFLQDLGINQIDDFDQTGFELLPPPHVAPADSGQGELFGDDYSQPDAADGEPVFWTAGGGQDFPDDDGVQPKAPD